MEQRSNFWIGASLGAASVVTGIVLFELVLWMSGIPIGTPHYCPGERENKASDNYISDPEIGWRMRPAISFPMTVEGRTLFYHADGNGNRTGTGSAGGLPPSVIIAGDSFAWGWGVEYRESVAGLLAASFPLVNTAMPGYGLDQIWLSVRRALSEYAPNLVLVIFSTDDLARSLTGYRPNEGFNKPAFRVRRGELVPLSVSDCHRFGEGVYRILEEHSRTFHILRRLAQSIGREFGIGGYWRLNAAIFAEIQADVERSGAHVVFVHIPYPQGRPVTALAREMEKLGANYLDLQEMLSVDWTRYYFPLDKHLNERGHLLLAQEVRQRLEFHFEVPE